MPAYSTLGDALKDRSQAYSRKLLSQEIEICPHRASVAAAGLWKKRRAKRIWRLSWKETYSIPKHCTSRAQLSSLWLPGESLPTHTRGKPARTLPTHILRHHNYPPTQTVNGQLRRKAATPASVESSEINKTRQSEIALHLRNRETMHWREGPWQTNRRSVKRTKKNFKHGK